VDGLQLKDNSIFNNGHHGVELNGGTYLDVHGNHVHNNGQRTPNTYFGIVAAANLNGFTLDSNFVGRAANYGTETDHEYDIVVATGTSDNYAVTNNRMRGGHAGSLLDGGSGANKVVQHNIVGI